MAAASANIERPNSTHIARKKADKAFSLPFGMVDCIFENEGPEHTFSMLRPLLTPWQDMYSRVVDLIYRKGYKIRGFHTLKKTDIGQKIVFLYHDVHFRDIVPALALAGINRQRGISSTFNLLWEFTSLDSFCRPGYSLFRHLENENVEIALHTNPVSAWLNRKVFRGDDKAYMKWVHTTAVGDLHSLAKTPLFGAYSSQDIVDKSVDYFNETVSDMKTVFRSINVASHHGDVLARAISNHSPSVMPIFTGADFIMGDRLERLDIDGEIRSMARQYDLYHFNETKNKKQYLTNLEFALESEQTISMINHPVDMHQGSKRIQFL